MIVAISSFLILFRPVVFRSPACFFDGIPDHGVIIIGIIGSVVGGFVAGLCGIKSDNWIGSFIISVIGAVICLLLYNYFA